jgi:DNA-binding transcriptional MerR regulator
MSDSAEALGIPRLADEVGVTPRVVRYWEEQGLIGPSLEHGKLRYAPPDVAIARMIKRLLDAGVGIDGVRMLRTMTERDVRQSASSGDGIDLARCALQILYARKAFREATGMDEAHFPEGRPHPPPPRSHGPGPGRVPRGPTAPKGPRGDRPRPLGDGPR